VPILYLGCGRLTGPLSRQFYVNQVGFSVWGVIFSTITTMVYVISGKMRVADPEASIRRMIKAKGCSAREAEAQLQGRTPPSSK
jgi:hypothetical protein